MHRARLARRLGEGARPHGGQLPVRVRDHLAAGGCRGGLGIPPSETTDIGLPGRVGWRVGRPEDSRCTTPSASPRSAGGAGRCRKRLLATRSLHFGWNELLWEWPRLHGVGGGRRSSWPHEEDSSDLIRSEGRDFKRCLTRPLRRPALRQERHLRRGCRMVRIYSARSLTLKTDRLPAISGIAKAISDRTKSENLAGVFLDDLSALTWVHGEGVTDAKRADPEAPIAPTWSWANADGAVRFPFHHQTRIAGEADAPCIGYSAHVGIGCLKVRVLSKQVTSLIGYSRGRQSPGSGDSSSRRFDVPYSSALFGPDARAAKILELLNTEGVKGMGPVPERPDLPKGQAGTYHLKDIENVAAVRICERAYRSRGHLVDMDNPCQCEGPLAMEVYSYLLLLCRHDTLDGCWRRIGLGLVISAPSCGNTADHVGFDGAEWKTMSLI